MEFWEEEKVEEKNKNWVALFVLLAGGILFIFFLIFKPSSDKNYIKNRKVLSKKINKIHKKEFIKLKTQRKQPKKKQCLGKAVVLIVTDSGFGSGTFVNPEGVILTNYHVVRGSKMQKVFVTVEERKPPLFAFITKIVAYNSSLDVALLKVIKTYRDLLGKKEYICYAKLGNSDRLEIGEEIFIYGYPGVGGDTITLTRGTISGFLPGWIKTDADIAKGNSGGAAFDKRGYLIGIPTAEHVDSSGGRIGLLRPINMVKPFLFSNLNIRGER